MATHSSILAGKSHGQRSLVDYSPWGVKESDMTKHTVTHTYTETYIHAFTCTFTSILVSLSIYYVMKTMSLLYVSNSSSTPQSIF